MTITEAQREMRTRFVGGFYGQLVSGILWLVSAGLATWGSPRAAITTLVLGGFFIFPVTELLLRIAGERAVLSDGNSLRQLGMQVAFVLPFSMLLLLPVGLYRLNWFYPALMVLVGAHYLPFVFLYGMRMFAVLAGLLIGGGVLIAMYGSSRFGVGAWFTGTALIVFAAAGRAIARRELRDGASGGTFRRMLHHISLGVVDLERSGAFYDAVLAALGYERVWAHETAIGYGDPGGEDKLAIKLGSSGVVAPNPAFHLALSAPSRGAVRAFHEAALRHGGKDDGPPGLRPHYGESYYAAFVADPDGHRIEAVIDEAG